MNIGFFGGLDFDCLKVDINNEVITIRVELNSHSKEILNLRRIKVFDDKGKAINLSCCANCHQSSFYKDDVKYGGVNALNDMPIHTEKELRPYIEITFKKPHKISHINIYNRMDKWGARSKTLRVVYCIPHDEWVVAHDFTSRKWREVCSDYTNKISRDGGGMV